MCIRDRRKIAELQRENQAIVEKQIRTQYVIEGIYDDLFIKNDTLKLFDKTIEDLTSAVEMEQTCRKELDD